MSYVNGHTIVVRTFGWVQDPGKFENLKRVVGTFYYGSAIHNELIYFIMSIKTFFATWIETGFKENYRDIVKILQIFLSGLMGTLSY